MFINDAWKLQNLYVGFRKFPEFALAHENHSKAFGLKTAEFTLSVSENCRSYISRLNLRYLENCWFDSPRHYDMLLPVSATLVLQMKSSEGIILLPLIKVAKVCNLKHCDVQNRVSFWEIGFRLAASWFFFFTFPSRLLLSFVVFVVAPLWVRREVLE